MFHLNIKGEDISIHSPNTVSIRAYGNYGEHLQGNDINNLIVSVQIMTTGARYEQTYGLCEEIHTLLMCEEIEGVECIRCSSSPLVIGHDTSGWQCVANYTINYFNHGGKQ